MGSFLFTDLVTERIYVCIVFAIFCLCIRFVIFFSRGPTLFIMFYWGSIVESLIRVGVPESQKDIRKVLMFGSVDVPLVIQTCFVVS